MTPTTAGRRATARSIADGIRSRIRSGEFGPGQTLPTSRELAEQHGVTIRTATAGFDILKSEGLVIGEKGGSRRVRTHRPITWNLTRFERGRRRDSAAHDDWSTAIAEAGREPAQHVTVHIQDAPKDVAGWLQIQQGDEVVKRVRMRTVDDMPFQLATSWFPGSVALDTPLVEERDVSMPGGILKSIGHPQVQIRDEISIRMPTPEESSRLELPPGTPVAEHVRIGFGESFPVRVMVTIAPGDRHVLVYELEV